MSLQVWQSQEWNNPPVPRKKLWMSLLFPRSTQDLRLTFVVASLWLAPIAGHAQKPELVVQVGHSDRINSVAFSVDGRFVLTGSGDKSARLWETATGKELRRFKGHSDSITSVAFSADRRLVLTGSSDDTARVWETATGKELRRFLGFVAFSADRRFVLTKSLDDTTRLWETATGKEVRRFEGHSECAALSADGHFMLTIEEKTARLWETANGKELRRFEGDFEWINSVVFSVDGRFVLTGGWDKTARLWETATGKELRRFEGHSDHINSVAFSVDGRFVLTGSDDETARLWEMATGEELRRFETGGSADLSERPKITSVVFSADGRFVLTGSEDKTARLWETANGKELRRFEGNSRTITSVAFSGDGCFMLTGSGDKSARLWETTTGKELRRFWGHSASINSVAFSADRRLVLTGSSDNTARLWETATGKEVRRFQGDSEFITAADLSADGLFVLTGSDDNTARLWDTVTGKELRRFEGHLQLISSVAFSADGRFVLTASRDETIRLWETATGKEVRRFEGHSGWIHSIVFSADGRFALTGSGEETTRLWEIDTGKDLRRFEGHLGVITSAAFSADGRFVLTGSDDDTARLWETATGKELRRFKGHSDSITSVVFSVDRRFVLTGSTDQTTRLWETATGKELCKLVSFLDGTWVVVDSEGRFDSDNLEEIKGLQWVMPDDPLHALAPETFMRDYYEPGLLARILKGEPFKAVPPLSKLNRVQPQVAITAVEPNPEDPSLVSVSVEVAGDQRTFTRAGKDVVMKTGVNDVRVFRDGQLVAYRDGEVKLVENKATLTFPGIRLARREGKTDVEFSAYAFNADRVKSATARRSYPIPATLNQVKGRAYVISVGVNDSEDPAYRLNYAVNDAQEIQKTIGEAFKRRDVFSEVVPITLVSKPTKRNFQTVLDLLAGRPVSDEAKRDVPNADKIAPARPEDTVLISFSSHGDGDRSGNFYLLPYDIGAADTHSKVENIYPKCISSQELSQWLRDVDAGEMVMIIDACHSAAAVESSDFKPGPLGSRGLGQLAYDKGMRILAASQADSVALESAQLGHGLLTYALLKEGLEAGQADSKPEDSTIWLSELLSYGVDRLPLLYAEKLGTRGVLLTTVGEGPPPLVQQPSLFDFTKQRRDMILATESEKRRN